MPFNPDQARHVRGTPEKAGAWRAEQREAADLGAIDLGPTGHTEPTTEQWANRIARLESEGFVPAASLDAKATDTRSDRGAIDDDIREDWWDRQAALAERNHAAGDYPQMPDDNTPGMHGGRASSGNRRTHRMNYQGAGVSLRMPSATAIKRFAKDSPRKTFDVPVTAEYPGGSVQGWVRVTQGGDGQWETKGLRFNGADDAYVGEAVRCVLEGRRPRHALAEAGDLIARRQGREAAAGAELQPVDSSWVQSVGYDEGTGTTVIVTKPRLRKTTNEVVPPTAYGWTTDRAAFVRLAQAEKPGVEVNNLKAVAEGVKMTTHSTCGRVYREGLAHRCPVTAAGRDGSRFDTNARTIGAALRGAGRRA